MSLASRLLAAVKAIVPQIEDVRIGSDTDRSTWKVLPTDHQTAAQATIDSFNANDPAYLTAELDAEVTGRMDGERIFSAIVWVILDTYSAPATIAKYNTARTKIVAAYKSRPWLP